MKNTVKRIISLLMTIAMLVSTIPTALAADSWQMDEYNSLVLPIVDEPLDDDFDLSVQNTTSGGGGGGGGGYIPGPSISPSAGGAAGSDASPAELQREFSATETFVISSGEAFISNDFRQFISGEDIDAFEALPAEYLAAIAIYEKDGQKTMIQAGNIFGTLPWGLMYNEYSLVWEFKLPAPIELEPGDYKVTMYLIPYNYEDVEEVQVQLNLNVTVTAADPENQEIYHVYDEVELKGNPSILAGSWENFSYTLGTGAEDMQDEKFTGYALSEDGSWHMLNGHVNVFNSEIEGFEYYELPAGNYKTWFFSDTYNIAFGPGSLKVDGLRLQYKYFNPVPETSYVGLYISKSALGDLESGYDAMNVKVSIDFRDDSGNLVHSIRGLGSELYDNFLRFAMSFVGFDEGVYTADITINADGIEIYLGSAELEVTSRPILVSAYCDSLTAASGQVYVALYVEGLFTDIDMMDVYLVDAGGNRVAETVSKEINSLGILDEYEAVNGTELRFLLGISEQLIRDEKYSIEICTKPGIELVSEREEAYIGVNTSANVVNYELIGSNTIRIYTENIPSGEYLVFNYGTEGGYPVTIDGQGIGEFELLNLNDKYFSDYLYIRDAADQNVNSYLCGFQVQIDNTYRGSINTEPNVLAPGMPDVENFYIGIWLGDDKAHGKNIQVEYANIMQYNTSSDGALEIIARMSDFNYDSNVDTHFKYEEDVYDITGKLTIEKGKTIRPGDALIEVKLSDGRIITDNIYVIAPDKYMGWMRFEDEMAYYSALQFEYSVSAATDSKTPRFSVCDIVTSDAYAELWKTESDGSGTFVDTMALSEMTAECLYGYLYTYTGSFDTELEEGVPYGIKLCDKSGSVIDTLGGFVYLTRKTMSTYADMYVADGSLSLDFNSLQNIPVPGNIVFKAIMGDNEYTLPILYTEKEDDNTYFELDFSGVPAGYFKLEAYYDGEEIYVYYDNSRVNPFNTYVYDIMRGYNCGPTARPVVSDFFSYKDDNGNENYVAAGMNLDNADSAQARMYRVTSYKHQGYTYEKLEYVKDVDIPKPGKSYEISVSKAQLGDVETGRYVIALVLDGQPVGTIYTYIQGKEPEYKAQVTLNGDMLYASSRELELKISANGYTKMRYAFSDGTLADANYQEITQIKTVTAPYDGQVTIYIEFSNEDGSKKTTVTKTITIDTTAPTVTDVSVSSDVSLWENASFTFTSNEPLRIATLVVGQYDAGADRISGKSYSLTLKASSDGSYVYQGSFYVGSNYKGINQVDYRYEAADRSGNMTVGSVGTITINQPKDITGTVVASDGTPISGAYVYLINNDIYNAYYAGYDCTDSEGRFSFEGIDAGDYHLEVSKPGYERNISVAINKADFEANALDKEVRLTSLYSGQSTVTVTVKDGSGAPINDAYVYIYSYVTDIYEDVYTNETGIAQFPNIPFEAGGSNYTVYTHADGFTEYNYVTVSSASTAVNVTTPAKVTVSGFVKCGDEAIGNIEIYLKNNGYTTYTTTNPDGSYEAQLYLRNGNNTVTVSASEGIIYSGTAHVTFGTGETSKTADLQLSANVYVKGNVKDANGNAITDFDELYFYQSSGYQYKTDIDNTGYFESLPILEVGKSYYFVIDGAYGYEYNTLETRLTITAQDAERGYIEVNFTPKKYYAAKFTKGSNGVFANASVIAKGDLLTVNVKCQNDGTKTVKNLSINAELPDGLTAENAGTATASGTKVTKTVGTMKADDTANMTFTVDTSTYEDSVIVIPAYVIADGVKYSVGNLVIDVVSATINAPQVVKPGEAFKVTGEAVKDSVIEIINNTTGEVLAITQMTGKWYSAEVSIDSSASLVARVTKDGKAAYSKAVNVEVKPDAITVDDIKVKANGKTHTKSALYDYPVFSVIVYGDLIGPKIDVDVEFENMPGDAAVKYSLANKKDIAATKDGDRYKASISGWKGNGTDKLYATVTTGGKEYKFIVADIIILIDPSGYITDEETGKPIEGALVLVEYTVDSGATWTPWDAVDGYENPMLTDSEGHYGWDVPPGTYRVSVTKDGYASKTIERYDSRDYGDDQAIIIPPMRTDVDIQLTNIRAVEVKSDGTKSVAGGRVKFVFSRPVDPATLTAENMLVADSAGNPVEGTLTLTDDNTTVVFKPEAPMAEGEYTLSVKDIKDKADNTISAGDISFTKTADTAALADPTVVYSDGAGAAIITFTDEIADTRGITVKKGSSNVSGVLRKEANLVTFIPDTPFTAGTDYKVTVADTTRTADDNYIADTFETTFRTPGGTTPAPDPDDGDRPSLGGGGGGGAPAASFKITVTQGANGKISPDTVSVEKGKSQTFTIAADAGYEIDSVVVNGKNVGPVSSYTFEKVEAAATITATFKKASETTWQNPFTDVSPDDWFYKAVEFASQKGITSGIDATTFAPNDKVTRGQFITMLCRAYGIEEMTGDNFADCSDTWYTGYLAAAKQLGISNGVGDNMFAPEKEITREEMVTLIYNYMKYVGAVGDEADTTGFADDSSISDWAKAGVAYAGRNGIVNGKGNNSFAPADTAIRAELVQIFYNIFSK